MATSLFPGKEHTIGDKTVVIRPLSMYELNVSLPTSMGKILDHVGTDGVNTQQLIACASTEIMELIAKTLDEPMDFWKDVPMDQGMEMIADFLEVNLTENFTKALQRAIAKGQKIGSRLFSS